jgi:two-component system cell cycle sensor histidine kinase/response regulator CckA
MDRSLWRVLFEGSFDALLATSPDGQVEDLNGRAVKLLGLDTIEEARRVNLVHDLFVDPGEAPRLLAAARASGRVESNASIRRRGGDRTTARLTVTAALDTDGALTGFGWAIADGGERSRMDGALASGDAHARMVFEGAADAIIVGEVEVDGRVRYIDANAAWERLTGLRRTALEGRHLDGTGSHIARALLPQLVAVVESRTATRLEQEVDTPAGRRVVDISIAPLPVTAGEAGRVICVLRDRTDERQAAAALRESEERYRLVFDNVAESLFLVEVTPDGRFRMLAANPAFERVNGVREADMTGRLIEGIALPEIVPTILADFRRCVDSAETLRTRREFNLIPGTKVLESTLIPVPDADGRIGHIVGISRDLTEHEAAERALEASEQQYRYLLEQAADAIFVSDASRRYTDVNIAACELLGYTRDELLALRVADVTPPDANPGQEDRFARMMVGETVITERYLRRKDGSLVLTELSTRRTPDGRFQAIARDITQRKHAEQEQARLVAAVEQAEEAIVITDPASVILYVNPAFERVSGYSREELIGANPRLLQSGQHTRQFYREMWAVLRGGRTWHGTLMNRRKDGTLFEEDAVISPIFDAQGVVVSYVGVKRDVTRERALEAQLQQARKMEAVGQLAGGIAHDFNNLITAIRGYTELISAGLPAAPDREDLDQIVLASNRAADLTRQLLAFARRQVLKAQVLSPAATIADLVPLLRRLLGEHIDVVTTAAHDAGHVRVDPTQLEQVIVNLAVNARDAMPDGGRLLIDVTNVDIGANEPSGDGAVPAGRYVAIHVSDSGSGMDDETRAHAFEPFFTTKAPGMGSGMGLATVYGIVRQSGGYIALESRTGAGTSFGILLPRVDQEATATVSEPSPRGVPAGSELILLVEDEPAVRAFERRVLERLGYTVVEAPDGEAALALANQVANPIDLLVADVVMPSMGGAALAARLTSARPGLRVLFLSGFADRERPTVETFPGASFLAKPFSGHDLGLAVRAALDGAPDLHPQSGRAGPDQPEASSATTGGARS